MEDLAEHGASGGEGSPDQAAQARGDEGIGPGAPLERLERTPSFGTGGFASTIGSAMQGLEQALRSQPPPEVIVRQHRPVRALCGQDADLVLVFPDESLIDPEQADRAESSPRSGPE